MKLKKSDTSNNAIIVALANVREHSNADRLQLATVLGTQVIVGLEASNGDLYVYFDSNLALSHEYLHWNNLYSKQELNEDTTQKGYFGKNGKVRAQRFRGEISNGFAVPISTLFSLGAIKYYDDYVDLIEGTEFTHIDDIEICRKFLVDKARQQGIGKKKKKKSRTYTDMFWKMWDTGHLMREAHRMVPGVLYIEEKIHGTSGRTANVLYHRRRRCFQFWKPKITSFWNVVSGTRRKDAIKGHMKEERRDIHNKLAPHIHKGEELYYEIFGFQYSGKMVQKGYPYGCVYKPRAWDDPNEPLPYKVMLYRVTVTTEDGYRVDLPREAVYRRAEELGLEKPVLLHASHYVASGIQDLLLEAIRGHAQGNSKLDDETLLEGVVVWFKDCGGNWTCLKHKSEEFLMREDKHRDKGIGDIEDEL